MRTVFILGFCKNPQPFCLVIQISLESPLLIFYLLASVSGFEHNRPCYTPPKSQKQSDNSAQEDAFVCQGYHDKVPQAGWLKQQKFVSHCSEGQKSKIQVSVCKPFSVIWRWLHTCCVSTQSFLCVHTFLVCTLSE